MPEQHFSCSYQQGTTAGDLEALSNTQFSCGVFLGSHQQSRSTGVSRFRDFRFYADYPCTKLYLCAKNTI
ncbi:hypothetical protein, partial [Sporolactobacillus inulinus]|uniref:hypothetical protein n=1 Tax=Sporolactobacillus inulinus TaxID=2078 RepID=UPI0021CCB32D